MKQLFLDILDEIDTVAVTARQEKEDKFIATIACKAAVKAKTHQRLVGVFFVSLAGIGGQGDNTVAADLNRRICLVIGILGGIVPSEECLEAVKGLLESHLLRAGHGLEGQIIHLHRILGGAGRLGGLRRGLCRRLSCLSSLRCSCAAAGLCGAVGGRGAAGALEFVSEEGIVL